MGQEYKQGLRLVRLRARSHHGCDRQDTTIKKLITRYMRQGQGTHTGSTPASSRSSMKPKKTASTTTSRIG